MYPSVPLTEADRREMLEVLGVSSFEELIGHVPDELLARARFESPELPAEGLPESEALARLEELAGRNRLPRASFLGAGAYDHYVPAAVDHVIRRSEFLTAYTPYQAEVSQGTLQAIFEFQSMVAALTGMDVANASVYDGASGAAEACLLALAEKRQTTGGVIAVSDGVDPRVRRVLSTYLSPSGTELRSVPLGECGRSAPRPDQLEGAAAFVVASPNFLGCVEELRAMAEAAHASKALLVVVTYPVALGLLESPGALGADVVVGDASCFGGGLSYGGPGLGLFAVNKRRMRRVPGRLAGMTTDQEGRRAYVLTLQAREQHIRRARATSNICTNQGLCALAAAVHMALLGREGLETLARNCHAGARYLRSRIEGLKGFARVHFAPVFNEFTVRCPVPAAEVIRRVRQDVDVVAGFDLGELYPDRADQLLVAVTERRTREDLDLLVEGLGRVAAGDPERSAL